MTRSNCNLLVVLLAMFACILAGRVVLAQGGTPPKPPAGDTKTQPGVPGSGSTNTTPTSPKGTPTASLPVMQIKKDVTGDFTYRFTVGPDVTTAPTPLPAPGTDNIISLTVPSTIKGKDAQLEVWDNTKGNIARLPLTTTGVTPLQEQSFKFAQRIGVPVQSKGQAVVGAQVNLHSKTYNKTELTDNTGVARFQNVPLDEQIVPTVSYGQNSQEGLPHLLERTRTGEGWSVITVEWADVKTAPLPAPPASATAPASGTSTATGSASGNTAPVREENHSNSTSNENHSADNGNPLTGVISMVLGVLFLAGLAYGLLYAWNKGHVKTALEKAGINLATPVADGPSAPNPFDKPAKAPITPITEGTADPFGGVGVVGGVAAAPVVASGPRLVATMGTYAGNIFPINSASADIGRDAGNAIPLPNDTNASRRHATIQMNNGQYAVVDNGSSNGTFLNGVRIASQVPQPLRPGDEVQVGMTRFRFEA